MARRQLLTDEERNALLGIPTESDALARRFTLSRADQELVAGRRGDANRLGYATQLALLRHPGTVLAVSAFRSAALAAQARTATAILEAQERPAKAQPQRADGVASLVFTLDLFRWLRLTTAAFDYLLKVTALAASRSRSGFAA